MNNSVFSSFKDAVIKRTNHANWELKPQTGSWFGKKIFLGYDAIRGWKIYELGFFSQLFRKLNLAFRDTHKKLILENLEKISFDDACLIPISQLRETAPKLKEKLQEIFNEKVVNKNNKFNNRKREKEFIQENREESLKSPPPEYPTDCAITNPNEPTSLGPSKPPQMILGSDIPGDTIDVKDTEATVAIAPLYLCNFKYTRCYIDSVLEIMLGQDFIRKKIFNECCRPELSKRKTVILNRLKDLILITHETAGKKKSYKSFIGKESPGEKIREAIFASRLNSDLSGSAKIYTQQDASCVLLLMNDLLDNSFQSIEVDTAIITQEKDGEIPAMQVTAIRPAATNHRLELRFNHEADINHPINNLIDSLIPLIRINNKSDSEYHQLIDCLVPLLLLKSTPQNDFHLLINQLENLKNGSESDLKNIKNQLIHLKQSLEINLRGLLDQYFTSQNAMDSLGIEAKRKFELNDGTEINLPYATQTKLMTLPDSLALHISRYKFDIGSDSQKLNTPVALPQDGIVEMTPYFSGKTPENFRYEITGYVIHHGNNLNLGHYTSNVKIQDKFYECDDLNPHPPFHKEISAAEFYANKNAYLVMLKRIPNLFTSNTIAP